MSHQSQLDKIIFDKLDLIPEAINPRYKEFMYGVDINFKYDPKGVPEIVDRTKYNARSFYMNNKKIKKAGVETAFTEEMKEEIFKCADDILYFAERYFTIRTLDHGKIKIPLRDYQKFWLRVSEFPEIRNRIWLACRQSAKSTTLTIEILHKMLFNEDYEYVILANKGGTAREIFARVRMAYEQLPLWMQPGVVEWNKGSVILDNDSRTFAAASSSDSIRGFSPNEVLLDEAAFVRNDEEFMASVYPTISSGTKSRITQISTPNGPRGIFYRDYMKAKDGKSSYFSFKVPWFFVPGRDEEWKKKQIEDTSYIQFRQEQDCDFLGTSDGLIDGESLERISNNVREPLILNDPELSEEGFEFFDLAREDHTYLMTVDTAEGKGQDSSTFTVFDITKKPFEQVCTYGNNNINPLLFPYKIAKIAEMYNMAYVIVENNNASGALVAQTLYNTVEYENTYCSNYDDVMGVGIRVSKSVKSLGCSALRTLAEKETLLIRSQRAFAELSNFKQGKNGSFNAAQGAHDDFVQNLWLFSWYTTTEDFQEILKGNLFHEVYREEIEDIENLKVTLPTGETMQTQQYDPFNAQSHRDNSRNAFW